MVVHSLSPTHAACRANYLLQYYWLTVNVSVNESVWIGLILNELRNGLFGMDMDSPRFEDSVSGLGKIAPVARRSPIPPLPCEIFDGTPKNTRRNFFLKVG